MEASRSQLVISFSSALLSCSSVAIALCALMLAFYSAYQTRKITRLSARPYVELTFDWNEKGAGWTYRNFGLGPAIVSSFEVSYDGERLRSWDELDRKLGLTGNVMFSVPGPGTISLPYKTGDNTVIFWMPPESRDKLVANSLRVRISTCYCSLYNECWKSFYSKQQPDIVPQEVWSCKVIPAEERFGVEVR
jgi:hypothetical protein